LQGFGELPSFIRFQRRGGRGERWQQTGTGVLGWLSVRTSNVARTKDDREQFRLYIHICQRHVQQQQKFASTSRFKNHMRPERAFLRFSFFFSFSIYSSVSAFNTSELCPAQMDLFSIINWHTGGLIDNNRLYFRETGFIYTPEKRKI